MLKDKYTHVVTSDLLEPSKLMDLMHFGKEQCTPTRFSHREVIWNGVRLLSSHTVKYLLFLREWGSPYPGWKHLNRSGAFDFNRTRKEIGLQIWEEHITVALLHTSHFLIIQISIEILEEIISAER